MIIKCSLLTSGLDGDRVRLTGFADFVGFRRDPDEEKNMRNVLVQHARFLFPTLKWRNESEIWIGYRPMSPDGLPFTGRDRRVANLFVSCGHGSNGWTTSAGTGQLLASLIHRQFGLGPELTRDECEIAALIDPNRFNIF